MRTRNLLSDILLYIETVIHKRPTPSPSLLVRGVVRLKSKNYLRPSITGRGRRRVLYHSRECRTLKSSMRGGSATGVCHRRARGT